MDEARSGSGQIAWYASTSVAVLAHILLLWSSPSTPPAAASVANAITFELAPPAPLTVDVDGASRDEKPRVASAPQVIARASQRNAPREQRAAQAPAAAESGVAAAVLGQAPAAREQRAAQAPAAAESGVGAAVLGQAPAARQQRAAQAPAAAESGVAAAPGHALDSYAGDASESPVRRTDGGPSESRAASRSAIALSGQLAPASAPAVALERGPRLLATRDPCAGFFPGTAAAQQGQVQLALDVDAQGHAQAREILLELPRGQGFENAAKACASQLHFAPALDPQGHPIRGRARIALRFERS